VSREGRRSRGGDSERGQKGEELGNREEGRFERAKKISQLVVVTRVKSTRGKEKGRKS